MHIIYSRVISLFLCTPFILMSFQYFHEHHLFSCYFIILYAHYLFLCHFINSAHKRIFYRDFTFACPFNQFLIEHFNSQTRMCSIPKCRHNIFTYFASTYSAKELTDLVYEALHDLDQAEYYLHFWMNHQYRGMHVVHMHI